MRILRPAVTIGIPVLGLLLVLVTAGGEPPVVLGVIVAVVLIACVLVAVHHAEVVAHRLGDPVGSLVLAVAVTVIEVGLILTLVLAGKGDTSTLARDTVFAAVMITCNGILGLSILLSGRGGAERRFNPEGSGAALGVVTALATLTLVLPSFTTSASGPVFSPAQLAFAAVASAVLYTVFVVTQTGKHRDFFQPVLDETDDVGDAEDEHDVPPTTRATLVSAALLLAALVAVVFLAKSLSGAIESGVASLGIPAGFVGVVIALLVLLPEGIAAARAARRERLQTSVNLAFGSAMASIGLTIPVLAVSSLFVPQTLALGLGPTQLVLLVLTVVVAALTVAPGRATRIQGSVHLIVFAAFVFLAIAP